MPMAFSCRATAKRPLQLVAEPLQGRCSAEQAFACNVILLGSVTREHTEYTFFPGACWLGLPGMVKN